jgi:hypothetical protein
MALGFEGSFGNARGHLIIAGRDYTVSDFYKHNRSAYRQA